MKTRKSREEAEKPSSDEEDSSSDESVKITVLARKAQRKAQEGEMLGCR